MAYGFTEGLPVEGAEDPNGKFAQARLAKEILRKKVKEVRAVEAARRKEEAEKLAKKAAAERAKKAAMEKGENGEEF